MLPISNLNSVLIKNYGQKQETLAIIRELAKLGLIKKKSKPKKERKPKMIEDLKQESDMVGYTKTLGGQTGQFPLRITEGGMTQQQIEDINRSNAAKFAALRSEVEQQRLEDIQEQQKQREMLRKPIDVRGVSKETAKRVFEFSENPEQEFIISGGGRRKSIIPPVERFRSAQESGAGQMESPFPETQDVPMSRTPNPKAPEFTSEFAETTFPEEETGNIPTAPETRKGLEPREKVGGGSGVKEITSEVASKKTKKKKQLRLEQDVSDELGLGKIPTISSLKGDVKTYYINLTDALGETKLQNLNKQESLDEINRLLKQKRN